MQETPEWEIVVRQGAIIGEVPVWSAEEDVLYWIDVRGPTLFRSDPETGVTRSWNMPSLIGSFALRKGGGGAIVALQSGIFDLDFVTGHLTRLHDAPYDARHYRLNDGKCDRLGRFWVGSMRLVDSPLPYGHAAFFRLDRWGLSAQIQGISVANGVAWSPDNRMMYVADSPQRQIFKFDYDLENGVASNRRLFVQASQHEVPDGAAVDAEGGYWITMMRGGRLLRYLPDGTLDRDIKTPTRLPTMVCFGGPRLDTLYLTTSSYHYPDEEARRREPFAGAVFRFKPGVSGIAEPTFAFL